MHDENRERLELKIAFLERANIELSDVVYRQQQELSLLKDELAALALRVNSLKVDAADGYTADQERPPHY